MPLIRPPLGPVTVQATWPWPTIRGPLIRAPIRANFGSALPEFEQKFAAYVGCKYGVAVTSGTLPGFLVRKAEKQHGTGQRIEGFREKAAKVVIVDDVCTTGSSTIQAVEAAREFGFEVVGVMCLVERQEANGRPNVEKAAKPANFISIFTATDVRKQHLALSS